MSEQSSTMAAVWLAVVATVGRWAQSFVSTKRLARELRAFRREVSERMDRVEARAINAEEHAASINRKEWRRDHPGQETPDPTLEPRTQYNLKSVDAKRGK